MIMNSRRISSFALAIAFCIGAPSLVGCGHSEEEWQAEMAKEKKLQADSSTPSAPPTRRPRPSSRRRGPRSIQLRRGSRKRRGPQEAVRQREGQGHQAREGARRSRSAREGARGRQAAPRGAQEEARRAQEVQPEGDAFVTIRSSSARPATCSSRPAPSPSRRRARKSSLKVADRHQGHADLDEALATRSSATPTTRPTAARSRTTSACR